MAKDQSKRLPASVIEGDKTAFAALKAINGYAPANATYALTAITTVEKAIADAQTAEAQASAAAAAARDAAVAREWELHNLMLGAKDQVVAQFGRNSNEVQSLGLKKESEYKPRARKNKPGGSQK